jgi:class 3 adenylate cyclase
VLNTLFGALVTIIQKYGGDVVKFCGDALLCIFTHMKGRSDVEGGSSWNKYEEEEKHREMDTREQVRAALAAAMAIQAYKWEEPALAEIRFKIGVGCGELLSFFVGGVEQRWEFLVAGRALGRACRAEAHAQPSQLVVGTLTLRRAHASGYRTDRVVIGSNEEPGDDGDWVVVTGGPRFVGGSGRGSVSPRKSWIENLDLSSIVLASEPASPSTYR